MKKELCTVENLRKKIEEARQRREWLYLQWELKLYSKANEGKFSPPTPFGLPEPYHKPSFIQQLSLQLERAFLVAWRNRSSKLVDTAVVVVAVIMMALLDGVIQVTKSTPQIEVSFDAVVRPDDENVEKLFEGLFEFTMILNVVS